MSQPSTLNGNEGAAFFGFMGVSMALVLASIPKSTQTLEQLMVLLRQAQASAASPYGALELS